MKILIVNTFYYPDIIGGTEVSVKKLAENLSQNGIEVVILCTGKHDSVEWQNNIKIIRRHFKNIVPFIEYKRTCALKKIIYKLIDFYNCFNKRELRTVLKEEKPDIIHTNNFFGISPIIWRTASRLHIPVVHTTRDYFLLCPKTDLRNHRGEVCSKCKIICKLYRYFYKKCSLNVNVVTAPSRFTLNKYIKNKYFSSSKKYTIYNAVDFEVKQIHELYELRKKNVKSKHDFHYIYIGAIEEYKGVKYLIDSFMSVDKQNITLNIAGKGSLESYVYESMEKDKRINFFGFLNEKELEKLLIKCDALIIPSIWEEPFGRVILDAYIKCMPVIGSRIGGITELIKNYETGILVESGNQQELSEAISLLEENRELNIKIYQKILKFIENFSIEKQIHQFKYIYKNTIQDEKHNLL